MKKFIIISLVCLVSCVKDETHSILYGIKGSADAYDVTIRNSEGDTITYFDVDNNWKYQWSVKGNWTHLPLFISAKNKSESGNVRVFIKVDKMLKSLNFKSECSGTNCIATVKN